MKKKRAGMRAGAWVLLILTALACFAVLELNKNTLWGWLAASVLLTAYAVMRMRALAGRLWLLRAGAFVLLVILLGLIGKVTVGPVKRRPAVDAKNPAVTDIVTVQQGQLTGLCTADGAVEVYAGIPYAKPPVGALRWREPQDPEPWDGVFAADRFAPMAMQPRNSRLYDSLAQIIGYHDYRISLSDNFRDAVSEDALYLNIWKPAGAQEDLPVLVYIHGGSLQTGQPWYADYSGEGLARRGVIVVNMGYRLGVFGFLATEALAAESPNGTTGNYGLLDQIQALRWVQENIAAFGGDPSNVTLAGESAGSACVSALCTSPLAKGLFVRAIAESSSVSAPLPAHSFRALDEALETGRATLERFGAATMDELRAIPAESLAAAADTNHHITIDGYVLTQTPYAAYQKGEHNEQALLHGFNAQESAPFILFSQANLKNYEQKIRSVFGDYADEVLALYPAATDAEAKQNWADIDSAVLFSYGHYCWTRQALACGVPVYEYYFSKDNGRLGAWHSGEEVYCYGNIPDGSRLYDDDDRALSDLFCACFASFASGGTPGLPAWQQANGSGMVMEFGQTQGMIPDPYLPLYDILDRMQLWQSPE